VSNEHRRPTQNYDLEKLIVHSVRHIITLLSFYKDEVIKNYDYNTK